MLKALSALFAIVCIALPAHAVPFACTSVTDEKTILLDIDSDTHPTNDAGTEYEVHMYIDSLNYGSGNVIKTPIEAEQHVKGEDKYSLKFEQGIIINKGSDSENCDMTLNFSQEGVVELTPLCCTAG